MRQTYKDALVCVNAVLDATLKDGRQITTIGQHLGLNKMKLPPDFPYCRFISQPFFMEKLDDGIIPRVWKDLNNIGYRVRQYCEVEGQRVNKDEWESQLAALGKARETLMGTLKNYTFNKALPAALNCMPLTLLANMHDGKTEHNRDLLKKLIEELIIPQAFLTKWLDGIENAIKTDRDTPNCFKDTMLEHIVYGKHPVYPGDSEETKLWQNSRGLSQILGHKEISVSGMAGIIVNIAANLGCEIIAETVRKALTRLKRAHTAR